eukprot:g11211.t1
MEKKTPLCLGRRRLKRPRPSTKLLRPIDEDLMFSSYEHRQQYPPALRDARTPAAAAAAELHPHYHRGERARDAAADEGPSALGESSSGSGCCEGKGMRHAAGRSGTCSSRAGGRSAHPRRRRRRRAATTTRALAATALALTLIRAAGAAGPSALLPEQRQVQQHRQARSSSAPTLSRLCSPAEDARAYVTTIADNGSGGGGGGGGGGAEEEGEVETDKSGDRLLGARVLAQSLRSAGAKGEVVVLVPRDRAHSATVEALRRDGLKVQIVPRGLQSAGGETVSEELMTKVFLWSLTSYDRVVFLDPRSLIQKNPDALFACEGFCAAGAVYSPSSSPSFRPPWAGKAEAAAAPPPLAIANGLEDSDDDDDDDDKEEAAAAAAVLEKPLSAPASWQPSTSVMVLEPSLAVHEAMLDELTRTQSVGSLEAQVFLSSFLLKGTAGDAGDRCTLFEDPLETVSPDRRRSGGRGGEGGGGGGTNVLWGSGDAAENDFGGGGGSFLDEAFMPVVLLNGPHLPRCAAGRKRTAEGVCQRLPYTFAAPSSDFNGEGHWGPQDEEGSPEPHIVHFADEDIPWKRLAYLHKPLFWKWNAYREQLEYPYRNFFAPWVLFFIPCVVLAFARVYYKTSSGSRGDRNRGGGGGGGGGSMEGVPSPITVDDCSPSKRRAPWLRSPTRGAQRQQQVQQQVAILPACGMAAAYDGAASAGVGSLEVAAAARLRNSAGCTGGGVGIAVGADQSPSSCLSGGGGQRLPVMARYSLSALVGGLGLVWFRAARALAREVVDSSWHPVISVSVHDAWLCCALVIGLFVMDYLYYALLTHGRTLLKDSVAVAALVATVRILYSMTGSEDDGGGGGGGGGGGTRVVWASAIGVGVIALGFGHGSRAGVVHRLSGRAHFRCVTASCVLGTVVSMTVCCAGPKLQRLASRRTQSAAATAQMVFIALVYASVIAGARLRCDLDDGDSSKIGRSCSTASFVSDALKATAPGKGMTPSASLNTLSAQESRATAQTGTAASAMEGGGGEGWRSAWSLLARAAAWTRDLIWQRRRVAACVAVLALWKASSVVLKPTTPSRRFEKYGQSCLESQHGYVEAGGKRLSRVCGVEQALRPVATGAYFEAFRQDKVCLEVAGGGFLTLRRVHVAPACVPGNQFVFQEVVSTKASTAKPGGRAVSTSTADSGMYCVYNPTSGLYLSSQGFPKAQCGPDEHWRVKPAPRAPGLADGGAESGSAVSRKSTVSALLHPSFLSRGPLHTFYGYLVVVTALLVARAVFSKLATSPCVVAGRGGRGDASSGGVFKHHRGLGARQRSRGRTHSRSRSSFGNFVDTVNLADAGYAGDAETGGAGYRTGGGSGSSSSGSSSGGRMRSSQRVQFGGLSPSVSPLGDGRRQGDSNGWTAEAVMAANRSDERRFPSQGGVGGCSGGGSRSTRPHFKREMSSGAASSSTAAAPAACWWLPKLFSGLVVLCDATLLAGLWCLIPAHFAQAMSALTLDHHSAIDQGLGMDSNANAAAAAAAADNGWSRSLGEGLGAPAEYPILVEGDIGGGGGPAAAVSCGSGAWWLMSVLIRWHLLLAVVAFCHLHAAVSASSSAASAHRWRYRRTGKKEHRSSGAFWGLRSGERLAMRLRTALGVLTLLCAAAAAAGPELSELSGLPFTRLHAHSGWGRCAPAAGLGEPWGPVSPLLVFAVLTATGGVYLRAGSSFAVRCGAGVALLAAGAAVAAAAGREYLAVAVAALTMDWSAWGIAGLLSCVCYLSESDNGGLGCCPPETPQLGKRDSSGSTGSLGDLGGGGGGGHGVGHQPRAGNGSIATAESRGVRQRITDAARRISPKRWVAGSRGRGGAGGGGNGRVGLV